MDQNNLSDYSPDNPLEALEHFKAIKHDPKNLLKALELCTASDSPVSHCGECPLSGICDPFEFPQLLQHLLRTAAPDHERSLELCDILDLCLEEDEDVCRTACPYYDRCGNEETMILYRDIYAFLKEVGAYDQSE